MPIIDALIEAAHVCPVPHSTRVDGRVYLAWPDGKTIRWEVRELDAVIDSGRAFLPVGGGGWTVNSATHEIIAEDGPAR